MLKVIVKRTRRKELALVTLVDLLVQILFVFTFVILARTALDSNAAPSEKPINPANVLAQIGRTLVDALSVGSDTKPPSKNVTKDPSELAVLVKERLEAMSMDREALKKENSRLNAANPLIKDKGPGLPHCKENESPIYLFSIEIIRSGGVKVSPTPEFLTLSEHMPKFKNLPLKEIINRERFNNSFKVIADYGASIPNNACKYLVYLAIEDQNMPAGEFRTTLNTIENLFRRSFK